MENQSKENFYLSCLNPKYAKVDPLDFYDIIVSINSFSNLNSTGWILKHRPEGLEIYKQKKNTESCIISVVGNNNKGKSFILHLLSEDEVPFGYSIKTEGLSIKYPRNLNKNIILLDTAGFETPLKETNAFSLASNYSISKAVEKIEEIARDKQIMEHFLQSFVIKESNILLVVVGLLTYSDQKLLNRIKTECERGKKMFVVHNLHNFVTIKQVEEYIEDNLKKSLTFRIRSSEFICNEDEELKGNQIYYIEDQNSNGEDSDKEIIHLILAFNNSEAGNYYNNSTITYLRRIITCYSKIKQFPVIERLKTHLFALSREIMEIPLESLDKIVIEDERIKIDQSSPIKLKKCFVDELGFPNFKGKIFTPKHSYEVIDNTFIITIELPGPIKDLIAKVKAIDEFYSFKITGEKIEPPKVNSIIRYSNRDFGLFALDIRILLSDLPLKQLNFDKYEKKAGSVVLYYPLLDYSN